MDAFSFKCFSYLARDGYSDNSEQTPIQRKKQTDLTEKVKGAVAVVPNLLVQNNIENKSENKLDSRDGNTADNTFLPKGTTAVFCDFGEGKKAKPTCEHHTPMGIAAPQNFYHGIEKGT